MSILDFLTGGVFTSLKELLTNMFELIIRLIMNVSQIFLSPLVNFINGLLPNIEAPSSKLELVLNYASPYINFILDLAFLSSPILTYLVLSIIFRVLIRSNSYITKLIIKWYHAIAP